MKHVDNRNKIPVA